MTEFETLFADWLVDVVTVAVKTGANSYGPIHADPLPVLGVMVDYTMRTTRTADGDLKKSGGRILADVGKRDSFPLGSTVTLPDGQTREVEAIAVHDVPDMPSHLEVTLL